jgi:putative ABC transport system permease protein
MPRWLTRMGLLLRSVFHRGRINQELDEELQYHLDRQIEAGLNQGLDPQYAREAALRTLGTIAKSMDECRDARGVNLLDDLLRDLSYAVRNLRRDPGFAALTILIMALGIGANTAVFSVVNAVVLRPLAYRNPDRLVTLGESIRGRQAANGLSGQISVPDFEDWRAQNKSFAAMAYYQTFTLPVNVGETPESATTARVSPGFLSVFEIKPVAGRDFDAEETQPGSRGGLLISYGYWQSHFGGQESAMGRMVRVYGKPVSIAGVLPPGFAFPNKTDIWFPANAILPTVTQYRGAHNDRGIARLKPGVSLEQARAEMSTIGERLERQYPESDRNESIVVTGMLDQMVGDVRLTLYLLLAAVAVVLLIACTNTATLLLGKAAARTREVAVRAALGASRRRIVRQLITESVLLSLIAGAVGLLLAFGGSKALIALAPNNVPRLSETSIDGWVLAFTAGVSLLTALLFGLVPALCASGLDLNEALKHAVSRSIGSTRTVRTRRVLVVAEIALAVTLVCGAGLLLKSFVALQNVELGVRPENVLLIGAAMPVPARGPNKFFEEILRDLRALPGVIAAGATMVPPGQIGSTSTYFIDHMPEHIDPTAPSAVNSVIEPGTLAALGIPLRAGRDFTERDTVGRPRVAIVNETLVRKSFGGQDPIGRTIVCPFNSTEGMNIVGVAGDVRQAGPARDPMPECFMPYSQNSENNLSLVVRTAGAPAAMEQTFRRLVHQEAPDAPLKFTLLETRLSQNVAAPRFRTLLFAVFAALAAGLAMAGVYGVMAYAVNRRSAEIGLRIALGASRGSVLRLVLGEGAALAGLGLVLGLAAAGACARSLDSLLFQVRPNDPAVYLAVAVLMGVAAIAASYFPARRAAGTDPLRAIREE